MNGELFERDVIVVNSADYSINPDKRVFSKMRWRVFKVGEDMKCNRVESGKLTRVAKAATRRVRRVKSRGKQCRQLGKIRQTLKYCFTNTSFHGLRYVVDRDLCAIERLLWLALFVVSLTVATRVICTLALRFQAAPTSIGIASVTYAISNLPFPSVVLCPNDRVDWNRALELERTIFPNDTADRASLETFRKILGNLSALTFGDFDKLDFLNDENENIRGLSGINVTQMLREVMPRCEELLSSCWWRNADRNCCEIFEVQRTEYGLCYSFNSELADPWPAAAAGRAEWSGVKVTIHLGENVTKPPDSDEIGGVVLMITGPHVWPNSGTMIPSGSLVSVSVNCVSGYATRAVLELDDTRIPCKYDSTGVYNQETCLSLCKRAYVIEHCGCNPSFLFPLTSQRDCNIADFVCLFHHNDLFNSYVVHSGDEIPDDKSGIVCDCPPECNYYFYDTQFSNVPMYNMSDITLDVHYIGQTAFRYKTDIVITKLDLIVSFGGIIGLFLGGSLLSLVELVYYLTVALFTSRYSRPRNGGGGSGGGDEESGARRSGTTAIVRSTTVLPILDYGPVKPPASRIPIFANYGLAKSNLTRY